MFKVIVLSKTFKAFHSFSEFNRKVSGLLSFSVFLLICVHACVCVNTDINNTYIYYIKDYGSILIFSFQ